VESIEALTFEEQRQALRFLLQRMGPETRRKMAAALPGVYSRLFDVDVEVQYGADGHHVRIGRRD
jgi:hypothetical protein